MSATGPGPGHPVVVMVPGLGLDSRTWRGVQEAVTGAHRVVLLPSLGLRSARSTDLRVEQQARRLLDELAAGGVGSAILIGHSASCAVVVEAAAQSPTVVGLVLVGPVTDPRARTWPRMLLRWLRTATHERAWEVPRLLPQYLKCGPVTLLRGMDVMRRYRTGEELRRVSVPVVVLRGSHDRIAPDDWADDLVETPGRWLLTAPGSAHMVPLTDPVAVARAVDRVRAALADAPSVTDAPSATA